MITSFEEGNLLYRVTINLRGYASTNYLKAKRFADFFGCAVVIGERVDFEIEHVTRFA